MLKTLLRIIMIPVIFIPVTTSATPGIMKKFVETYPETEGSQLASCRTCHLPIIKDCLNSYAVELRENSLDFSAVEEQDADGDGTSNIEEIKAQQLPGSQAGADEVFVFTNSFGAITFNHEKHSLAEAYLSEGKCANCHSPDTFPRKFDDTEPLQKIAHPVCRGCHKESGSDNAPQRCFDCHDKSARSFD